MAVDSSSGDRICRLCTREVSHSAIDLFSSDSVERGVADRMANVLELPLGRDDGLSGYVCELCNARFKHLVRSLEVNRLNAKKSYEKLAKKAGIFVEPLEDPVNDNPVVEDAKNPPKDDLVKAADMTSMDLGSLLSDLVAAKKRMREKKAERTEKKLATEDIKDLMNLLSGISQKDVFVFGTFLGVPEPRLRDIEMNHSDNHQRQLTEVVTAWINTCPDSATWPNLVEALTEVGRRKTAQEVAEKRGLVLPGVFDDGQLWKALKALIPTDEGSDILTLMDETERLRKDVKTKDAILVQNEEQLEQVNEQKQQLEMQYNSTLQELEEKKEMLEEEKRKAQKALREKEAELRKLRAERASKEEIESMEIEIMYLKKRVEQHKAQEKELMTKMVELQEKLEAIDFNKLDWIAKNLEKQLEGVRPEFEEQRSQMISNIYKMLKYVKIPDDLTDEDEEEHNDSPDPDAVATAEVEGEGEVEEETPQETAPEPESAVEEETVKEATPEPEPADLESLLSLLKSPVDQETAMSMFEDKPFLEEDHSFAVDLFQGVSPFLLSQILGLPMDQWKAIETASLKDQQKQLSSVLQAWRRSGATANWSDLVETLTELGLRGKAQTVCLDKGIPLPQVNEDGPVWSSMKETLLKGNDQVKQSLAEVEGLRLQVKSKNEDICIREAELEQARMEGELIKSNLKKTKQDLAVEMRQCKEIEAQINTKTLEGLTDPLGLGELEPDAELRGLKERHRQHMSAVESLWKQLEEAKAELESRRFEPRLEDQETRARFDQQRAYLVYHLEEMYELYTGREKPVPKEAPVRPPPPPPRPKPAPAPIMPPPPAATPGGYRATNEMRPDIDPVPPTGYTIMDLFHPDNTFSLLPAIDLVGRPLFVAGNMLIGISIRGRGALSQECHFTAEIVAPFIVTLRLPNRGRLMVNDQRTISIKNTPYQLGTDPAFEFVVRPYRDTKVTFESRKFPKTFLSVNQNAQVSVQQMPPDSGEVQFAIRIQKFGGPYTTRIVGPFGRPSLANQLKDRSVIQLYCKASRLYLAIRSNGTIVGMNNAESDATYVAFCDHGLGRVTLQSYVRPIHKIKMRFNGILTCQGEENLDSDFYLKENPDATIVFESVPNKGRYITIPKDKHTLIRNFNVMLLEFTKDGRGKTVAIIKRQLN